MPVLPTPSLDRRLKLLDCLDRTSEPTPLPASLEQELDELCAAQGLTCSEDQRAEALALFRQTETATHWDDPEADEPTPIQLSPFAAWPRPANAHECQRIVQAEQAHNRHQQARTKLWAHRLFMWGMLPCAGLGGFAMWSLATQNDWGLLTTWTAAGLGALLGLALSFRPAVRVMEKFMRHELRNGTAFRRWAALFETWRLPVSQGWREPNGDRQEQDPSVAWLLSPTAPTPQDEACWRASPAALAALTSLAGENLPLTRWDAWHLNRLAVQDSQARRHALARLSKSKMKSSVKANYNRRMKW